MGLYLHPKNAEDVMDKVATKHAILSKVHTAHFWWEIMGMGAINVCLDD